ncbi:hypothetical protein BPP3_61 [Escherichia phage CLB_P3]|nr:hypothetical protein BPP3_61 [Escherichia phage CLB_P3]
MINTNPLRRVFLCLQYGKIALNVKQRGWIYE